MKTLSFIQRVPIPGGGTCNNPVKGCASAAPIDNLEFILFKLALGVVLFITYKHVKV